MLIIRVPILIDKDVFEPSYNDLKFMVQTYYHFCTNLVQQEQQKAWLICSVCICVDQKNVFFYL